MAMPGGFNLKMSDSIEYAKKPGKMQLIKVAKDSSSKQDFYKSGTVHTSQGQPPNSVSRPLPKGKPVAAKPFTKGRLIRPGGPGGRPSKITSTPARNTQPVNQPAASQPRPIPQPAAQTPASYAVPSHTKNVPSASSGRSIPPPPPPAPPASKEPQYRVLYDFTGQSANEVTMKKDDLVTIIQKENNGKIPSYLSCNKQLTFHRMVACKDIYRPRLGTLSISPRRGPTPTTTSRRTTYSSPTSSSTSKRYKWCCHSCKAYTACPSSEKTNCWSQASTSSRPS